MDYNRYPFWIRRQLERLSPKDAVIQLNKHLFKREHRNLEEEKIFETVKEGKISILKSLWPGKLVFKRYYGKENETYIVVTIFMKHQIEVRTAWKKTGK